MELYVWIGYGFGMALIWIYADLYGFKWNYMNGYGFDMVLIWF